MVGMVIYKIFNKINGKMYIGQTINFKNRIRQHKKDSEWDKKSNFPLYRATKKYGWDSFIIEIIDIAVNENCLNKKEEYWIKHHDTTNPNKGYNVQAGGKNIGSKRLSEVLKKAKSNGTVHDMKVLNVTDNIEYRSTHECARQEYPNIKNSGIAKCCNPKSKHHTYKGKVYRYIDENGNIIEKNIIKTGKTEKKPFLCIEDNIEFESMTSAYTHYKISKSYFQKCMKNNDGYINKIKKTFKRLTV